MLKTITARLRLRTTWVGLAALLGLLGVQVAPEAWEGVVTVGTTLADAAELLLPLLAP